ncbi:retrotransposon protein, putative, ty1-copia subclass [Tanacetum coccineum]
MAIQGGRIQKANKKTLNAKGKGKEKGKGKDKGYISKPKNTKPSAKGHPAKDDTYHHYKEVGHYKRNCPAYLAELIKKKKQVSTASSSDIFIIELFSFPTKSWVYDTSCGTHICITKHGIRGQLTPPYTPQLSGVSKRRNHTLLNMVQSMMNLTTLSLSFWDYALESAARILNMVPTKKVDKTPYELWYGKVPNLSYLKVWGCEALVKRDTPDKLQQRSIKCIFIGYLNKTMEVSGRARELKEIQDENTSPSEITSEIPIEFEGFEPPHEEETHVRRSVRTHRAPERLSLNVEVEEHNLGDLNKPTNYKAAMLDPKSNKWLDAMNAEMQSMKENQVWSLVDLPPNGETVGSK